MAPEFSMPNYCRQARLHRYSKPKFCVDAQGWLADEMLQIIKFDRRVSGQWNGRGQKSYKSI
jgi:hypothetical protein